jgi:TonB family protein
MKRWTNNLILLCTLLSRLPALGQSPDSAHGVTSTETQSAEKTRKLIYKVAPVYPPDLKRFYIGGTVRLDVKISPQGTVRTVSPVGGNPVLVEAAVTAVKRWKYTPASSDTETQITIVFDLHH